MQVCLWHFLISVHGFITVILSQPSNRGNAFSAISTPFLSKLYITDTKLDIPVGFPGKRQLQFN